MLCKLTLAAVIKKAGVLYQLYNGTASVRLFLNPTATKAQDF